jgi:ABC-type multidrug transport system, ATPase and permease components
MIRILKQFNKKEWIITGSCFLFIVIQIWLDLRLPEYMSQITQLVQSEGSEMNAIYKAGIYMLLCALGSLVLAILIGLFASVVAASFSKRLRSKLFNKVESFSIEEINRFSMASLLTRSTNDVTQVQHFITIGLQLIIRAPIMAVWATLKIMGKSGPWSLATMIAVICNIVAMAIMIRFVIPKFRIMQKLTDNLTRVMREHLMGLRVIRAYNAEHYQEKKFEKVNEEFTSTQVFTGKVMSFLEPVMSLVMGGLSLSIYWIGAYIIQTAGLNDRLVIFSDMVVFSSYAMQVVNSFMMISILFILFPRAEVSAKRITEVLDTISTIVYGTFAEKTKKSGEVTFNNVSFRYPDTEEYVLQDINFTINRGETVGFIGSTGSGKSTLINLIPRFFDVTEGEILIDGIAIKDYSSEALYNKVGYVPQKATLFTGTVSSNVAFGETGKAKYSDEAVKQAVKIAQATEFVEKMEDTYEADISQGGANVSGGQKQRLSIARAIYRKPDIYIFDDSFSALDYKTDRSLRTELKKATSAATSLIVSQRIGTIMDANRIIVLDEGKIVGEGTHKELLTSCDVYHQIAVTQLSEEELKHA